MTAGDVAAAIRGQNIEGALGQIGQPPIGAGQAFQFPIDALGRLNDPKQFEDIIVKVGSATRPRPRATSGAKAPATSGAAPSGGAPSAIGDPLLVIAGGATSGMKPIGIPQPPSDSSTGGGSSSGGATSVGGAPSGGSATGTSGSAPTDAGNATPDTPPTAPTLAHGP